MTGPRAERRRAGRARTRLRPGKLLGLDGVFLADCAVLDRSPAGSRVRSLDAIELPETFVLFDEAEGTTRRVSAAWHRHGLIGLRHEGACEPVRLEDLPLIAGPYYAMRA
jgi:hypothetical protein